MHQSKLTFINWNPDEAPLKKKVLYATAKESFKTHLGLNTRDYTITSKNDVLNIFIVDDFRRYGKGTIKVKLD